ncbi:RNA polymerase II transcription factor B subunit 4 [Lecanora helva]
MNTIDGSDHYDKTSDEPPPSLLVIILDTNPHAWSLLSPVLSFSSAIANLLVFIDAHLAFNNANKVAIVASHTQRAEFLYPPAEKKGQSGSRAGTNGVIAGGRDGRRDDGEDTEMGEANDDMEAQTPDDANHYRPFRHIQATLVAALTRLLRKTKPSDLTPSTSIAGALSLALTYINKTSLSLSTNPTTQPQSDTIMSNESTPPLHARLLLLSVSSPLAHHYIPITNTIFAAQRQKIPIDILQLSGEPIFLQQASDATGGVYIKLSSPDQARGLLQYLMMGFLPDQTSRKWLVLPTGGSVDFRAACFCHRKVVDVGFVCSICLSSELPTFSYVRVG